jgi:hypothetical protein
MHREIVSYNRSKWAAGKDRMRALVTADQSGKISLSFGFNLFVGPGTTGLDVAKAQSEGAKEVTKYVAGCVDGLEDLFFMENPRLKFNIKQTHVDDELEAYAGALGFSYRYQMQVLGAPSNLNLVRAIYKALKEQGVLVPPGTV